MFDGFARFLHLLASGMELAIEEAVGNFDEQFVQATQQVQKGWCNDKRQNPGREAKVFLNASEFFMSLGDGDADGQAKCGEYAAAAQGNRDADHAALPDGLRGEIGEDAARQI